MAYIHTELPFDLLEDADPEGLIETRKGQEEVDNQKLYNILQVPQNASLNDIKKAYQQLARKNHPDKGGDKEKFQEIQNAYNILSDQEKRASYDKYGLDGVDKNMESGNIFDMMFQRDKKEKVRKMPPIRLEQDISLEDAYCGKQIVISKERKRLCSKCQGWGGFELTVCPSCEGKGMIEIVRNIATMYQKINLECDKCQQTGKVYKPETKCKDCRGEGIVQQTKDLQVSIQKGTYQGLEIVLYGEGEERLEIMAGDIVVLINIIDHEDFEREGADLRLGITITLKEALCGFQRTITHLDGADVSFRVQPGMIKGQNQTMTLRNKGMPFYNDIMSHGNMFVIFFIEFPNYLPSEIIQQLAKILPGPKISLPNFHRLQKDDKNYNPNPEGGEIQEEEEDKGSKHGIQCAQQ